MKKAKYIVSGLVAVLFIGYFVISIYATGKAEKKIDNLLSKYNLGQNIKIGNISYGLFSGSVELEDIELHNVVPLNKIMDRIVSKVMWGGKVSEDNLNKILFYRSDSNRNYNKLVRIDSLKINISYDKDDLQSTSIDLDIDNIFASNNFYFSRTKLSQYLMKLGVYEHITDIKLSFDCNESECKLELNQQSDDLLESKLNLEISNVNLSHISIDALEKVTLKKLSFNLEEKGVFEKSKQYRIYANTTVPDKEGVVFTERQKFLLMEGEKLSKKNSEALVSFAEDPDELSIKLSNSSGNIMLVDVFSNQTLSFVEIESN